MELKGKLCVCRVTTKNGNPGLFLGVDMGYTIKSLTWNSQDVAEVLGLPVIALEEQFPYNPGPRQVYYLG